MAYLFDPYNSKFGLWIIGLLAVASGALLMIGFLTPLAAALVGVCSAGVALSWFPVPALNLFEAGLSISFEVIIITAIILLGPGTFSLDARLFGRREIIIPPAHR